MKRGSNKKAISPLIATVLLIAFTVTLAVIVMNWGQGFFKKIQEQTEETTSSQLACINDVGFEIEDVCKVDNTHIKVRVKNTGASAINSFIVRSYQSDVLIERDTLNMGASGSAGLNSFDVELSESLTVNGLIKKVELIPELTFQGKNITCSEKSFGDEYGSVITNPCS